MKSGQEIVDYIDRYMKFAVERPEAYGLDALDLESVLFALDRVRQYAVTGGENEWTYPQYLHAQGFDGNTFMTAKRPSPSRSNETMQEFREFTDFWRGYLAWRDRK